MEGDLWAAPCHLSSAREHFLGFSYAFFSSFSVMSEKKCRGLFLSTPFLCQDTVWEQSVVFGFTTTAIPSLYLLHTAWVMWYFGLLASLAKPPDGKNPTSNVAPPPWCHRSHDPAVARLLPRGKHRPGFPALCSLCGTGVSYPERLIAVVHHSCVCFASAAPVSDHVWRCWLWGCYQKLVWMSPPWALNQWQRLLPCTWDSPFASFLKHPHDSPPSETTGILQSNWIAPGIKHEHAWHDILPRVDWDFIQQLTAGTYTLCWTWMLG